MTPQQKEAVGEFIRSISQAAGTMALYSKLHRLTVERAHQSLAYINQALADDDAATVIRLGDELFVNGLPLDRGPHLDRLMREMADYGIGYFTIGRGATYSDIELLILIIAHQAARDFQPTPHLKFGMVDVGIPQTAETEQRAIPTFSAIPRQLIEQLVAAYDVHDQQTLFDVKAVYGLVAGFITAFRSEANPFLALVPLRGMDEYTFTHSIDVCILNLAQGISLGFEGQLLHDIGVAAMLHDVGKQFIPPEILNKPGDLKEEEWEIMRSHTVRGAAYLLNNPGIPRLAVMSAFEHHMKFDLSGYPKVPAGWQTNICSQITMVSDCFDALRTKRIYDDAMDFEKTAGIMLKLAGTSLNPTLTLNFLKILRKMEDSKPLGPAAWAPPALH